MSERKITFKEDYRKKLWDDFEDCELKLKNLKSIVQNEMPVSLKDIEDWDKERHILAKKLNELYISMKWATSKNIEVVEE